MTGSKTRSPYLPVSTAWTTRNPGSWTVVPLTSETVVTLPNPIFSKILTTNALATLPEPSWIIRDVISTGSMAWLAGAPGAYKSFMAIDWACSVSLGVNTVGGRRTQATNVMYMACEGTGGLPKRVEAWEKATGLKPPVAWLPEAVQIGSVDWAWLRDACVDMNIGLLVIDTYSRVTVGMDEINVIDQGRMISRLDTFRQQTGAAILAVHHKSAGGKALRGHTSLEGAADTVITMDKADNGVVTMHCAKQKETEQWEDEYYRASPTARSMVLVQTEKPAETVTQSKPRRS